MPNHKQAVVVGVSPCCAPASDAPAATANGGPVAAGRRRQPETSSVEQSLRTGLIAGSIGYAVAAVFFAVAGALEGRSSFDIATLLRGTLFVGTGSGQDAMVVTEPVVSYNGARLVTFLVAGVFIAWLASIAERAPQVWLVGFMLLLFVAAPVLGLPTVFEKQVQAELSPWVITAAMSLAAIAMAIFLRKACPALRGGVASANDQTTRS